MLFEKGKSGILSFAQILLSSSPSSQALLYSAILGAYFNQYLTSGGSVTGGWDSDLSGAHWDICDHGQLLNPQRLWSGLEMHACTCVKQAAGVFSEH